jgi:tetraacyldisaccharide 4'-kinase
MATACLSVGNIAMGGRGKTPVVELVTRLLLAEGERPAILTRGYHRRTPLDGVVVVSDGASIVAGLDESGDEPMMLAEALPAARVLVSDVRTVSAAIAERALGATVHVMDDGFQHRALARDVDIVLVAPQDLDDRRLPFGRLRESPVALNRADAIILDAPAERAVGHLKLPPAARAFRLRRRLGAPRFPFGAISALDRSTPVVALAAIAEPERFDASLKADGWTVARLLTYRDHHRYTTADVNDIIRRTREAGAQVIVTTAKDAIRLRPHAPLAVPVAVMPLEVSVDAADGGAAFGPWLMERIRAARESRA